MAFQTATVIHEFLRRTAKSTELGSRATAENFLLEERLSSPRENHFVKVPVPATTSAWDDTVWQAAWRNHYECRIKLGLAQVSQITTFADVNRENWLASIETHQDVVRLESATNLFTLAPSVFLTPQELVDSLRRHVEGTSSPEETARLQVWLRELNGKRDARPAFAAPFGEVQEILDLPDWATKLRDFLGLASLAGAPAKPTTVILCRYGLKRAETAIRAARHAAATARFGSTPSALGDTAWAAVPTVLEAGGERGPNPAFFPLPRAAGSHSSPFGITLSLASDQEFSVTSELLHFRIDYQLSDFVKVGEIRDEIPEVRLKAARQRQLDLLQSDFRFIADIR